MRRILLATVALAALGSASALAADLPQRPVYKTPVMAPAPVSTWTGCYIGGNIGGAFGNASASAPGGEVSGDNSGFAGGGQVGCDYQFSGGFVLGFRDLLDYTSNSKSGTFATGPLAGGVANFNNQWFDTLTARLGYAMQPDWLLYFQGGAAWAHTSTNVTFGGLQLARPPAPEAAGRLVVALNGCSHRTGRHFLKVITWTSARALQRDRHAARSRQLQRDREQRPSWCELSFLLGGNADRYLPITLLMTSKSTHIRFSGMCMDARFGKS